MSTQAFEFYCFIFYQKAKYQWKCTNAKHCFNHHRNLYWVSWATLPKVFLLWDLKNNVNSTGVDVASSGNPINPTTPIYTQIQYTLRITHQKWPSHHLYYRVFPPRILLNSRLQTFLLSWLLTSQSHHTYPKKAYASVSVHPEKKKSTYFILEVW